LKEKRFTILFPQAPDFLGFVLVFADGLKLYIFPISSGNVFKAPMETSYFYPNLMKK
tara:strand:+ start:188405 stop:188575 length:171 start_codon:yes stop_codon:yes gene_type:complete